jgi:glycosyltransferase involved in cell wall biosynthesis
MATILHLITGLGTGGAERMLARLAARTDRHRFRSVVVSMTDGGTAGSQLAKAGVELKTLGLKRGVPDPRGVFRLGRILRETRPDLLQTWLYHADFLGLIARCAGRVPHLVWNLRCSDMNAESLSRASLGLRRLLAWSSAVPDAVIVNSLAGKAFHQRIGYRPRRWDHVPNGFDTAAWRPDAAARRQLRGELGVAPDAIVIGLPARYHPMKDHATFLAAAARLAATRPQVVFLLVGTGTEPGNAALARAVAAHGIGSRMRLLGEREDMVAVYSAIDIATLSSAQGEGFPNVLGEAMCCGRPCVATDNGDASQILGEASLVVPPRRPDSLAAAWDRLIAAGEDGRRVLGEAARVRIARDYGLDTVVSRYQALYEEITSGDRPGAVRPWRSSGTALFGAERRAPRSEVIE